ncbi:GNAT family N-acetyltransferase [Methylobacterium sp. ID0610]|uniref:GNAT family N-acetyltransferase n=1 Tax=Methylobacterium carpenticola TaxID=3344827 RepID=UPI003686C239
MRVRAMEPADIPAVAALLREMQEHYRVPCPPDATIRADLGDPPAGVTILIAADPGPVGLAALAAVYPGPGLRPGLFLKELFVAQAARGRGTGRALLRAAAAFARAGGFARIDWTADGRDPRLLAFYAGTGALPQPEKVFFRLSGEALERMAAPGTPD